MAISTQDRDRVFRDILAWPLDEQLALAQDILRHVAELRQRDEEGHERPSLPSVPSAALRGLLANDEPAPTDEDVARWLDEARMEKYGGSFWADFARPVGHQRRA
jgi:hypothetical protein